MNPIEYIVVETVPAIQKQLSVPGWKLHGGPFTVHNTIVQAFTYSVPEKQNVIVPEIPVKSTYKPKKVEK
jgi:hypothetical protein